jgi:peptidyl-prolyl cis-trans isomerase D
MQFFRNLAGNIFFKIILGFVALSFVLFGISGFILGSPNSWIAKVGNTTISSSGFNAALRNDRELVLASNKSAEAAQYVESQSFKSDVLGRMVNKIMIEKLSEDFGISASKKVILSAIAKDPSFKNESGKFDHKKFEAFLANNGLNEERYVNEISNDVTSVMILQTLALSAPVNDFEIQMAESFKQEKRVADVITISEKNATNLPKPNIEEIEKFYGENKQGYTVSEMRKVSYIHFSAKDFAKDLEVSDQELRAEYEKNKSQMMQPESRNFYHLVFAKEDEAKKFLSEFEKAEKSDKSNSKEVFAKLAKSQKNKDLKAITLNKMTQKDLLPQLADVAFKLEKNAVSQATESPLGFHVFLLIDAKKAEPLSFEQAKTSLKKNMMANRDEKVLQEKISAIDDLLLTSNSLSEVAKKFNLKVSSSENFNVSGQNEKGAQIPENSSLEHFAQNAFALKDNQTSKIFYAKNSSGFYALKVEKILPARERKLAEVESQIIADLQKVKKTQSLRELANKIASEVKKNPESAAQIAEKYHVSFDKNREFARYVLVNVQGRQMAYQSKFLEELFSLQSGETTSAQNIQSDKEFSIGILRNVKKADINPAAVTAKRTQASEDLRNELMSEYNSYLMKLYPVKVNEKLFVKKEEK